MNNRLLKILLGSSVLLFVFSLFHRIPDVDDAWVGELAYWQSKLGYARSELMRGVTMQEIRHICHHKFLTIQGGWFINLFGFGLYTLKSISLLYYAIFICSLYGYVKLKSLRSESILILFLLLFANALIFEFSFVYRPEIPVMTLGFLSYIFLERDLKNDSHKFLNSILAGLFAGLCVATHLNGIVFIAAGIIILAINKKFTNALLFAISTIPSSVIYFYDFRSFSDFSFWMYQMTQNPSIEVSDSSNWLIKILLNIVNEQKRFFHSAIEISFSVLAIIIISLSWKHLKRYKTMLTYTFILIIFIGIFSVHKSSKYAIIYLPYLMLIVTYGITNLIDHPEEVSIFKKRIQSKSISIICTVSILFYFICNSLYNFKLSSHKFSCSENSNLVSKYIKGNTHNLRIVAPMIFIFNEIDSFNSIQGEMYYTEMQKTDKSIYQNSFLEATKKFNIDYIILSSPHIELLGMDNYPADKLKEMKFEYILKTKNQIILKKTIN